MWVVNGNVFPVVDCSSMFYHRGRLQSNMQQLEGYDSLYESLSQWLKDTEVKVRGEAGLKPSIEAKQSQLDAFKVRCFLLNGEIELFEVFPQNNDEALTARCFYFGSCI